MNKKFIAATMSGLMILSPIGETAVLANAETTPTITHTLTADKKTAKRGDTITITLTSNVPGSICGWELPINVPEGLTYVVDSGTASGELAKTTTGNFEEQFMQPANKFYSATGSNEGFVINDNITVGTFQVIVDNDAEFGSYTVDLSDPTAAGSKNDNCKTYANTVIGVEITVECNHSETTDVEAKDATCTEKGHGAYTKCNICEEVINGSDKETEMLNHTYDKEVAEEKYFNSAATCTSPATYFYSCTCGAKGETTFEYGEKADHSFKVPKKDDNQHWNKCEYCETTDEKVNHTYDQEVATGDYLATAATCTAKATYYKSCTCGARGAETFTSGTTLDHTFNQQNTDAKYLATAATCTAKATYFYSCTCGENGTETFEYGETLPHTYDKQVATEDYLATAATCTAKATYFYSCTCGAKGSETFESGEPAPHNHTVLKSSAEGHWYQCENCSDITKVTAHNFTKKNIIAAALKTAATCKDNAVYYLSCETCEWISESEKETFVAEGTATNQHIDDNDAWETDDNNHWHTCKNCTDVFDTTAHKYDQETVNEEYLVSEATYFSEAVYNKSCVCGQEGTETFKYGEKVPVQEDSVQVESAAVEDNVVTETLDHMSEDDATTAERIEELKIENPGDAVTFNPTIDTNTSETIEKPASVDAVFKCIDISVMAQVGATDAGKITQLSSPITFRIAIPESVAGVRNRTFVVLREHNGEVEEIPASLTDGNILTFSTDKFSTFAIAYKDVVVNNDTKPNKVVSSTNNDYSYKSEVKYDISFETNKGSKLEDITKSAGATVNLNKYIPTRKGYTFDGWFSDKDLTHKVDTITIYRDRTVYAKWVKDTTTSVSDSTHTNIKVNPETGAF